MAEVLLDIQHLTHRFPLSKTVVIPAVEDISFTVQKGEIFGLVGESGSGKSTVARCVMNVYRPCYGTILYKGINICDAKAYRKNRKMLQSARQFIFQDSTSSLSQHMTVAEIIAEPMSIHHIAPPRGSHRAEAAFQLQYLGMDPACLDKYPHQLSGGMRQRVAIARALAMKPELLVADEPIAALDVSIQAQVINLFAHLRQEHSVTILFIAHDLSVVRYLCDRVGVMYRGRILEIAPTLELFDRPLHPYTKSLIASIPLPDPVLARKQRPQVFNDASFCKKGALRKASPGHFVWTTEERGKNDVSP